MSLDVDAICTDDDLAEEVGGADRLNGAVPDEATRDRFRAKALQDVLQSIAQRSPPIFANDLADATELKNAVLYRALSKIFMSAFTQEGDMHHVLMRRYDTEYLGAVRAPFRVSPDNQTGPSGNSFTWERG